LVVIAVEIASGSAGPMTSREVNFATSLMAQIGRDVVVGLVNGIKEKIDWAKEDMVYKVPF